MQKGNSRICFLCGRIGRKIIRGGSVLFSWKIKNELYHFSKYMSNCNASGIFIILISKRKDFH